MDDRKVCGLLVTGIGKNTIGLLISNPIEEVPSRFELL